MVIREKKPTKNPQKCEYVKFAMILLVWTNYLIQINQILNLDANLMICPTMKKRLLTIHYLT